MRTVKGMARTKKAEGAGERRIRRATSEYLAPPADSDELHITRSEGQYVWDAKGRRFLDLVMGWGVGNLGWGHPEIRRALRSYSGPDYVHPSWVNAERAELATLLARMAPGDLRTCYRATGGTEAVDIALQLAMAFTGRAAFVSIEDSYHGNSVGTVSVGPDEAREQLPNLMRRCHRLKPPLDARAVARLETRLKKRDVAAVVMEPILMGLGVHVPSDDFMRELPRLCRKYGTLLVLDEVACGFGRTGRIFAAEHYGLEPDILCLAKAITSGYAAMGATMTTERISKKVGDDVSFYSTYGWHPLSVAAALATARMFEREGESLMQNVAARSQQFESGLRRIFGEEASEIRVKGLAIAVEFSSGRGEQRVEGLTERCRKSGLLVSDEGDTLMLLPALTIDEATVDEALGILERCWVRR